MRYAIIANPKAGRLSVDEKRVQLAAAAKILNADIFGLETSCAAEFSSLAVALSRQYDVLVIAGGDGTFSDIINAIYPARLSLAYLPMGTGNAIRRTLAYRGQIAAIAQRLRNGRRHRYDLIRCNGKRMAFMASVGIDGTTVKLWSQYRRRGYSPLQAYGLASFQAIFRAYRPGRVHLSLDQTEFTVDRLLSLMVVKHPHFGFGMNVVPQARWDDGYLHTLCIPAGLPNIAATLATAFTVGNRVGNYRTGARAVIRSEKPLVLQIDGDLAGEGRIFSFDVVPGALFLYH